MKLCSETSALALLDRLKADFTELIRRRYEHRAQNCLTCKTPGACCLDAHFVNVHITRLEAAAIERALAVLPGEMREKIDARVADSVSRYGLSAGGDTFARTFACPLFEPGIGCLVHSKGKPLPCIQHACYDDRNDMPPDELLAEQERSVDTLNRRAYGRSRWLPLPVALQHRRRG